jgi:hypothetical protein
MMGSGDVFRSATSLHDVALLERLGQAAKSHMESVREIRTILTHRVCCEIGQGRLRLLLQLPDAVKTSALKAICQHADTFDGPVLALVSERNPEPMDGPIDPPSFH